MKIVENPAVASLVLKAAFEQSGLKPREPGLHVSDLIYCLRKAWWRLHRGELGFSDDALSIMLLGEGHHGVLEPRGQGEHKIIIDAHGIDVHGTIDVFVPDLIPFRHPTEIKTTRTASTKLPADSSPWYIEQLASYCLGVGDTEGLLLIWHIMGQWGKFIVPELKAWEISFKSRELVAWRGELARRATLVLASKPPVVDGWNHYEWECKLCPLYEKNGGPCEGGEGKSAPFFAAQGLPAHMGGDSGYPGADLPVLTSG